MLKWHMFAGGTGAVEGKHSYKKSTHFNEGGYEIQPVTYYSSKRKGYKLYFINKKGILRGGLWQEIGLFNSPNAAKEAANKHYVKHFGR